MQVNCRLARKLSRRHSTILLPANYAFHDRSRKAGTHPARDLGWDFLNDLKPIFSWKMPIGLVRRLASWTHGPCQN